MKLDCIVCSGEYHSTHKSFPLCKKHLLECQAIDRQKQEREETAKRKALVAEFIAAYPTVVYPGAT